MNRIKITAVLFGIVLFIACSSDDGQKATYALQSFVRFNFLVSSNNQPLEYPAVNSGLVAQSSYANASVNTLKIPVTLSTTALSKPVTVDFSTTSNGDESAFSVTPSNQLTFNGAQLTDTIYVNFNERWSTSQSINFKLESVSNPSIAIGNLNSKAPNDEFTVNLETVNTTYTLSTNRLELMGTVGEEISFKVNFPNGYIPSEIESAEIFQFLDGFDYTLTQEDFGTNRNSITYTLKLNENLQNDDVFYQTIISLVDTDLYTSFGNRVLQIVKPINTLRDNSVNTASNFYNLSDGFYRTFGEHWNDFNNDGVCAWQSFFAFTFPVVVNADDPNAVLFDDLGNNDPQDDIYHHAFKIGFNTTTSPTATTNPFNLKRWFSNESSSSTNSPGFNIPSAIEFFPENGNSTTNGTVLVIPQFLTIAGTNGNTYTISIAGEGTYTDLGNGLFEIDLEFRATNDALFGGTISSSYKIYNNNSYTDPEPLATNECLTEYIL